MYGADARVPILTMLPEPEAPTLMEWARQRGEARRRRERVLRRMSREVSAVKRFDDWRPDLSYGVLLGQEADGLELSRIFDEEAPERRYSDELADLIEFFGPSATLDLIQGEQAYYACEAMEDLYELAWAVEKARGRARPWGRRALERAPASGAGSAGASV